MLISIIGIDGCGKSTVVEFLKKRLENDFKRTVYKESYPSKWLLDQNVDFERMNSLETIALFSADIGRSQGVIEMNMSQKDYVITDRYHYCTFAYNCETSLDIAVYEGLSRTFIKPDLTVLVNIPVTEALNRVVDRGDTKLNYFENKEKLENASLRYRQKISRINYEQMLIVNGSQAVDEIVEDIVIKLNVRKNKYGNS